MWVIAWPECLDEPNTLELFHLQELPREPGLQVTLSLRIPRERGWRGTGSNPHGFAGEHPTLLALVRTGLIGDGDETRWFEDFPLVEIAVGGLDRANVLYQRFRDTIVEETEVLDHVEVKEVTRNDYIERRKTQVCCACACEMQICGGTRVVRSLRETTRED